MMPTVDEMTLDSDVIEISTKCRFSVKNVDGD